MSQDFIRVQRHERIVVVSLLKGVINAIDGSLVEQLSGALSAAEKDPDVQGIVLSSSNDKFFSIGFDIPQLYNLSRDEFVSFYRSFNALCIQLYSLPKPSVAAITGHAIAVGCILALCCDRRIIAEGRKLMGLNEIKLGVPVPFVAECIVRQLVSSRHARGILETGAFYQPEQLLQMGLVDAIEPAGQVLERAVETVQSYETIPPGAYAAIKQSRVEEVKEQVTAKLDERNRIFIECWYSPAARHLLQKAMEKF
ncbi:MAG: hypothetical protein A2Z16_02840 [Chloroflexi bacterium RBG_16_54_18]|nr:MAG: hypothetical protein A2Z16_02840 [Chloroflexi bacterium RBG_16_54_18]